MRGVLISNGDIREPIFPVKCTFSQNCIELFFWQESQKCVSRHLLTIKLLNLFLVLPTLP